MSGSEPGHRIESVATVYEGWGRLLLATLRTPDGSQILRQVEDHGNAVGVLPYDAARGTVLLVRQSRPPLIFRGEIDSVYEVLAGRIDAGEDAEATARREALEECGVALNTLALVGHFFSMPAVSTERLSLYLAPYSLADRTGAGGGLADDHEDIEVIEMRLDELWAMGMPALADMKTAILVLALRERLAAQAWPPTG